MSLILYTTMSLIEIALKYGVTIARAREIVATLSNEASLSLK